VLKYIFGAIFIALAWAAKIVFREVDALFWVAIGVTVVVVLGIALWVILKAVATRKAASAIEAGLGEAGGRNIRPDQQAEITAMQVEFQKAISGLKSSRLGHRGRDALGVLPWYIIIGPPGAGKTTALRSSGLQFPYAKGGKVKGVGGTRNCDWWLTNEAIILDTAGRWSTQDDDHEEWLAFLDLLHKTRPKKPVNGILLAVSLLDLEGGEEEMAALAKALRDRLDEVTGRLEMVVPVYLLVTKSDLVPGFVEMFGDLRDKERGQIWGVTLPLIASPDERAGLLEEQLQELFDVVGQRAFTRLCDERRVDARHKIFEFQQQLEGFGRNLSALVGDLFAENVYQDAPILRGVYFTSGTQEGRPIDRIMQSMASAFGISGRAAASVAVTKPKSYFLRDVFTNVVFPDQAAAVRSTRVMRKQRMQKIAITVGAFALAAGFLFLPIRSYSTNSGYAKDVLHAIDKLAVSRASKDGLGLPTAQALESIEEMAKSLAEGESGSVLFPRSAVTKQLHIAIERLLVRPIIRADLAKAASTSGLGASDLMDALILHLLLTQDKQPDEPTTGTDRWEGGVKLAAEKASARWVSLTNQSAGGRAPRVVENLVKFYAGRIKDPADMIDRDKKFVNYARTILIGAGDDPLAEIINDPSMPRDLKSIDLLGSALVMLTPQQQQPAKGAKKEIAVRGAFTPDGYTAVKKRLHQLEKAQDDDENSWILGKERKVHDARAIARIQAEYYVQYIAAWKRFLLTLSVREPSSLEDARSLIKKLNAEKPFEAAWKNISENLVLKDESLADKAMGLLKGAVDKKTGGKTKNVKLGRDKDRERDADDDEEERDPGAKQVEAAFVNLMRFGSVKPTGFEKYGQILTELAGAMGDQGMPPDVKAFQTAVRNARTNLSNLIAGYDDGGWEQGMLEKILMPPLRGAEVAVVGATADSANRKWCETVFVAFDQLLGGKYPFATTRTAGEARIADIEKFFQPNTGTLWQYYNDSLANDIERVGNMFRMKDGAGVHYRDEFLKFLTRAAELTSAIFAREPTKMGITVGVHIRPSPQYSKIILDLGPKKITGLNAIDRWDEFVWPVRRASLRLFVKNDEIETIGPRDEGEWAFFYLLGLGANPSKSGDGVSLTYMPASGQTRIQVDFKPEGIREIFQRFGLPRGITAGGGSCRK
jgi:type VI secretion system protein ImpL